MVGGLPGRDGKEERMKTAAILAGLLSMLASTATAEEPGFEVKVTASGLN